MKDRSVQGQENGLHSNFHYSDFVSSEFHCILYLFEVNFTVFCALVNTAKPAPPELNSYKEAFTDLRTMKTEIEHLQHLLEKSKVKLMKDFEIWWAQQSTQKVGKFRLAAGSNQRHLIVYSQNSGAKAKCHVKSFMSGFFQV